MEKAALFWSGGKDSAYALFKVLKSPLYSVQLLVTTLAEPLRRVSIHGVREELLDQQAKSVGLPLHKMWVPHEPSNNAYEEVFLQTLDKLKEVGFTTVIFGDIFLEDLRIYREQLVSRAGLHVVFPLWGTDTRSLVHDFINEGFKSVVCCISSESLEKRFLGKELGTEFLEQLPPQVDPCGENGEYHSFCYDGPIFQAPIPLVHGEEKFMPFIIKNSDRGEEHGCSFLDLLQSH